MNRLYVACFLSLSSSLYAMDDTATRIISLDQIEQHHKTYLPDTMSGPAIISLLEAYVTGNFSLNQTDKQPIPHVVCPDYLSATSHTIELEKFVRSISHIKMLCLMDIEPHAGICNIVEGNYQTVCKKIDAREKMGEQEYQALALYRFLRFTQNTDVQEFKDDACRHIKILSMMDAYYQNEPFARDVCLYRALYETAFMTRTIKLINRYKNAPLNLRFEIKSNDPLIQKHLFRELKDEMVYLNNKSQSPKK